jgi:hypothetical protein
MDESYACITITSRSSNKSTYSVVNILKTRSTVQAFSGSLSIPRIDIIELSPSSLLVEIVQPTDNRDYWLRVE